jgi:hypothetical protein
MARGPGRFAFLAVASSAAVLAVLGGCTADSNDSSILVLKNVHPDTTCVTTGLITEASVPHGSLDILIPSDYLFIAQMESRIVATDAQVDQRTIITKFAKVDVAFPNTTLFSAAELADMKTAGLTHFRSNFSAPVLPNDGISDGAFVLIPSALVEKVLAKSGLTGFNDFTEFRLEVEATFTIEGDMSGSTVNSQPFTYGVTLGNHTSISILPAQCPVASGATLRTGYACNALQDGVVDCCLDTNGLLNCPAPVKTN